MTCPLNDIRDFKAGRKATAGNVVQLRRGSKLHRASAAEAIVEVTIESVTCEEPTMSNASQNDKMKAAMADLSETVNNVLNDNNETTSEENTMTDNNTQTETISITSVTDRYKKLRRNTMIAAVAGNVAWAGGMVAGAAMNGRNVKRAAIVGGVWAGASVAWMATNARHKEITQVQAKQLTEKEYQAVADASVSGISTGAVLSAIMGTVMGAFLVRKAVSSEE